MNTEINVHNPEYIVRKRLGRRLQQGNSREDSIENMGRVGEQVDNNIFNQLREDYQEEITDVLSDMEGRMDQTMMERMDEAKKQDDSDPEERLQKFMRLRSLQFASEAYDVFKSIVTN